MEGEFGAEGKDILARLKARRNDPPGKTVLFGVRSRRQRGWFRGGCGQSGENKCELPSPRAPLIVGHDASRGGPAPQYKVMSPFAEEE